MTLRPAARFDGDFLPTLQQGILNLGLVVGKTANTKACGSAFCDPGGGADALCSTVKEDSGAQLPPGGQICVVGEKYEAQPLTWCPVNGPWRAPFGSM